MTVISGRSAVWNRFRNRGAVLGNRRHPVRLSGADIRALEAAASHLAGPKGLGTRRREQVGARLLDIADRYRLRDFEGKP